ncbi:MAG: DUF4398 domain-containing protein [Deltaproteobacteria bacterium]|jgi:hypothetical protein|nr:DUF4398 domain-containing protein [Deltaproteobacteria bacterium]
MEIARAHVRAAPIIIACLVMPLAVASVGCSSVQRPTAELAAADTALGKAQEAQAAAQSPLPLKNARDKVGTARQVIDDDAQSKDTRHTNARRLAEEARADADLAEAQARAKAARRGADELRIAIEAVRREVGVGTGAPTVPQINEPSAAPPAYPIGGGTARPIEPLSTPGR